MRGSKRWLGAAVAGAVLFAACGGDDDDAASTEAPSGTEAPVSTEAPSGTEAPVSTEAPEETTTTVELTGEPVTVYVLYEGSGSVATPEVPEGALAAAEALNRNGGIGGSPVEIVECDLANDPNTARECGQKAVDAGAAAVVGPVSANSGEFLPLLEAAQIPVVGNVPASAADFSSPASFPLYGGIVTASAGLADVLVAEGGASNVALARIDLAAAAAIAIYANMALSRSGLAVGNDVSIPIGAPDMATYVAAALQGGTDGVLVGLSGQDATNFIIQLRQTAPDVPISATTTEFSAVVEALGDAADGIYVTGFFDDATSNPEGWEQYTSDMDAAGFDDYSGFRTNSYSAVQLVAEVLGGLSEKTGPALYAALPTVDGIDLPLLPPLQFVEGGVGGVPRLFNPCGLYRQLQGGEFVTLSDGFFNMLTGEAC